MSVLLLCIAGACGGEPEPERPPELSVLARWTFGDINLVHEPEWVGQRAIHFREAERPRSDYQLNSLLRPLTVHAEAAIPVETAEAALTALELSQSSLSRMGWPAPLPDGGLGETPGFDLYLTTKGIWGADASPDKRTLAGALDATTSFGIVDVGLSGPHGLDACITSALAQAITLNLDPAEGKHWRRATGAFLAWQINGQFGAADAVDGQQLEPWRSWIEEGVGGGEGGALLLALLSRRYDGGDGSFIREMWQFTRQNSLKWNVLRGSPDLWETLEQMIIMAGDDFEQTMESFVIRRVFAGPTPWLPPGSRPEERILGIRSPVPIDGQVQADDLPVWLRAASPGIWTHGSRYTLLRVRNANPSSLTQIWLKGEYGVRWALLANRLEANGESQGTLETPPGTTPSAFLPIHLEPSTAMVLIAATHHGHRRPDSDVADNTIRAVRLTLQQQDPDREDAAASSDGDGDGDAVVEEPEPPTH